MLCVKNGSVDVGPIGDLQYSNRYESMHSIRKFTWKELSKFNEPHNAHVAYRGKVSRDFN